MSGTFGCLSFFLPAIRGIHSADAPDRSSQANASVGWPMFRIGAFSISVYRDRGNGLAGHREVPGHEVAISRDVDCHAHAYRGDGP